MFNCKTRLPKHTHNPLSNCQVMLNCKARLSKPQQYPTPVQLPGQAFQALVIPPVQLPGQVTQATITSSATWPGYTIPPVQLEGHATQIEPLPSLTKDIKNCPNYYARQQNQHNLSQPPTHLLGHPHN